MTHVCVRFNRGHLAIWLSALAILAVTSGGCAKTVTAHSYIHDAELMDAGPMADPSPSPNTYYAMSRMLRAKGRDDQSELVLMKLIADHPCFLPAYCDLAQLRVQQGRLDDAQNGLAEGLRVAPDDPVLRNNAGVCFLLEGDYANALDNFEKAAERMPREPRYQANQALALGMLGHYDEALTLYNQILPPESARHNVEIVREMRGGDPGRESAVEDVLEDIHWHEEDFWLR